jgi:CHAD domain-containing protein
VRRAEFQRVLRELAAFADGPGPDAGGEAGEGLAQIVSSLSKLSRQVRRGARHFDELPFERRHDVRKRLKRLRYLAEFAAPAFERADVKAWLKKVSPAQEALGRHVDLVLAERHFAAASRSDARFAVGWLRAKSGRSARDARRALARLRDAKPFW